jgi:hypothetical protein
MRRFEESERKKGSAQQRPLPTLRVQVVGTFSHQKYVMTTRQTNKCKI